MLKVSKNSKTILLRSDPKHSHVNGKTDCQSTRCYMVSVKLFLTPVRNAYLWSFFLLPRLWQLKA